MAIADVQPRKGRWQTMRNHENTLLSVVLTVAAVGQIVLTFLLYNANGVLGLGIAGWVLMGLSAIFGWLPILTLRRWGGVPKGRAYVHTQAVVDRGMYALVRHPQYLAGILMGAGLGMIAQHWLVGLLGVIFAGTCIISAPLEERADVAKFGDAYRRYQQRVPRLNAALGILRWIARAVRG